MMASGVDQEERDVLVGWGLEHRIRETDPDEVERDVIGALDRARRRGQFELLPGIRAVLSAIRSVDRA